MAYDLEDAMDSFAPAAGANTAILPMLNGMAHLEALENRFGPRAVLGGLCFIASTLGDNGEIVHLNANHTMVFGERDGTRTDRIVAIEDEMRGANFESRCSDQIVQEMWEKWVFIATGAGITCLMRGSVGEIEAAGGAPLARQLLDECAAIATTCGHRPSDSAIAHATKTFTAPGSPLTASMFRDIERGGRTEGEHILGDLLRRGGEPSHFPMLRAARTHVATYESRRAHST
jgi:2-dehydropantoate 2-reductase